MFPPNALRNLLVLALLLVSRAAIADTNVSSQTQIDKSFNVFSVYSSDYRALQFPYLFACFQPQALLTPESKIERSLGDKETHRYEIQTTAGQFWRVVAEQRDVDLELNLFAPDGSSLIRMDSPNGSYGAESISFVATTAGSYRIETTGRKSYITAGTYQLTAERHAVPTPQDLKRIEAEKLLVDARVLRRTGGTEALRKSLEKYLEARQIWHELPDPYWEACAAIGIGWTHTALGDRKRAINSFQEALSAFTSLNDTAGMAHAAYEIAYAYQMINDKTRAIDMYKKALPLYQSVGHRFRIANTLNNIGTVYSDNQDKRKALDYYLQAKDEYKALKATNDEALTRRNIGYVYEQLTDRPRALEQYTEAIKLFRAAKNNSWLGRALREMGLIYERLQQLEHAIDSHKQALDAFLAASEKLWMARSNNSLGYLHKQLGRLDEALNSYNEALGIAQSLNNAKDEMDVARNAIDELQAQSRLEKATRRGEITPAQSIDAEFNTERKHSYTLTLTGGQFVTVTAQQKGCDIELAVFDSQNKTISNVNLVRRPDATEMSHFVAGQAATYRLEVRRADELKPAHYALTISVKETATEADHWRYAAETKLAECVRLRDQGTTASRQAGIVQCRAAIPLWQRLGDKRWEARTHNFIGNTLDDLGRQREALPVYFQALDGRRAAGDVRGIADALSNIGLMNAKLLNYPTAIDYYQQSIETYKSLPDEIEMAGHYLRLARIYETLKDNTKRRDACEQAASLYHGAGKMSQEGRALVCSGEAATELGQSEQAQQLYERALPLLEGSSDFLYQARLYRHLGESRLSKGDPVAALNYFKQALEQARTGSEHAESARALEKLGELHQSNKTLDEALYYYRQSLRLWRSQAMTNEAERILKIIDSVAAQIPSVRQTETDRNRPQIFIQTGQGAEIREIKYSPDGRLLASASDDNSIRLWEVSTGRELRALIGHNGAVMSLVFSKDGRELASASNDHTIKLWDIETGRDIKTFTGHSAALFSVAFSPDGSTLASASDSKKIRIWDVSTAKEKLSFDAHESDVYQVVFSHDGKLLASSGEDGAVKLWDPATGRSIKIFEGTKGMTCVAFSPDGKTIAAGSNDLRIHLWDVATGREIETFADHSGAVMSIAFSEDGRLLLSGSKDKSVKLWDIHSGSLLHTYNGHTDHIWSVAFNPSDLSFASAGNDSTIKIWNFDIESAVMNLGGQQTQARAVTFSNDGRLMAYVMGSRVVLWDLKAGETVGVFEGHKGAVYSIAFSHDDKLLATASADKTAKLWSVGTRQNITTLTGHSKEVWGVAFSPDDQRLITVSDDKKIKVWNVSNGAEIKSMVGGKEEVQALAFSRDGRWFATGSADGTFTIWNAETYARVRTSKEYENSINSITFSSDGRTMATGDGDGIIRLWDVESGRELHTLTGHSSMVGNLAFSPDGRVLASAGYEDLTVKLWDVHDGRGIRTLKEHNVDVFDVAFTPNGRFLISTSLDGSARVWHADSGELLLTLAVTDPEGHWLAVTPEGLFDGSAVAWQRILWRFENKTFNYAPVETYFNDFFHPSLLQEIFEAKRPQPPAGKDLAQRDRRRPSVAIQQVKASNNSASANTRNVTINVEVTENVEPSADPSQPKNGGAQDVRMFRNGSLVKHWGGDVFHNSSGCVQVESKDAATDPGSTGAKPRKAVCTATVPIVAGDNKFIAYAFNHHNLKSDDSKPLTVTGDRNRERKGTLYVLAIGINNYKDERNNLNFAVPDVDKISKEVKAEQERLGNYSPTIIISLTDQLATKSNIKLALRRFAEGEQVSAPNDASPTLKQEIEKIKDIQPEDAIVLYYAGHGTAVGERFYLLPHDFSAGSEEQLKASSISDVELNEVLERVNAGKVLMVIDACRSGQVLGGAKEGRGPMNSKGLAQLAYDKGMYILTAAQSFQAAKEVARTQTGKDIKHGLLTFALLEGLSKANKDNNGRINERDWMNYAVEQVPRMQIEEMDKHNVEIKQDGKGQGNGVGRRGIEPVFVEGDKETDPEKWNVQRPRVFYRRELEAQPLIVARP